MIIGIDIGGTHTRVATGKKGKVFKKEDFPTKDFETTVDHICNRIEKISKEKLERIGVSVAGPYNFKKKVLLKPPNLPNQESWGNKNISEVISERFSAETIVAHDASASALGEAKYGAGQGKDPVLYYTVSTGVGSGLIAGGKIFHGIINPEAGHQIINRGEPRHPGAPAGDLESIASGSALKRLYNKEPVEVEGTVEWDELIEWLAIGFANSILHFSPEIVVVGGGMTKHEDMFFTPLNKAIKKYMTYVPAVEIVPAGLGQDVGLIGALTLAENPSLI